MTKNEKVKIIKSILEKKEFITNKMDELLNPLIYIKNKDDFDNDEMFTDISNFFYSATCSINKFSQLLENELKLSQNTTKNLN
jgi:hypothetical protein